MADSTTKRTLKVTTKKTDQYYVASQYRLMWLKLRKHRLALAGGVVLLVL